jgi:hypothetical protein
LWAGGEKLVCAEATAAATVTSNHALSDAGRNSAAIDVAGFLHDTLKIPAGTVPSSIIRTSTPGDVARIDDYDYYGAITQELVAQRWARPDIRRPQAYLRKALLQEAHRYYAGKLREQRLFDGIGPALRMPAPGEFRPDHVVVPFDLERGLAVLRAAGLPEDVATLLAERYLRHQRRGDVGVDFEAAQELGWSPKRLDRVQAALRHDWGARVRDWFIRGSYRPRKKIENRVGGKAENPPLDT